MLPGLNDNYKFRIILPSQSGSNSPRKDNWGFVNSLTDCVISVWDFRDAIIIIVMQNCNTLLVKLNIFLALNGICYFVKAKR